MRMRYRKIGVVQGTKVTSFGYDIRDFNGDFRDFTKDFGISTEISRGFREIFQDFNGDFRISAKDIAGKM